MSKQIDYQQVLERANERFRDLCRSQGRFTDEIRSLQVKGVLQALIEVLNEKFKEESPKKVR